MESLLTVKEAAKALNISVATLREWVQYRRIPFIRVGRCIRFRSKDIEHIQKEGLNTKTGRIGKVMGDNHGQ